MVRHGFARRALATLALGSVGRLVLLRQGGFFAEVAIAELGPFTVVFARVALAALALNGVLAARGQTLFRRGTPWPSYFAMGLLNNFLPFSLIFWAQTEIASGLASILNATTPLFTLVAAHLLTDDEKIDRTKTVALLTGLAGVAVLVGPDVLVGGSGVWGQLACLGAAISYALPASKAVAFARWA
ncbi:hypothetical protein BH11PSE3_BH11PSE3_10660 [soil metagenome]